MEKSKNQSNKIKKEPLKKLAVRLISLPRKVKNNKIIFLNFSGEYDCNLKAICDEIIKQKLDYELVWATFKESNDEFPPQVRKVIKGSYAFYKEIASSKVIFDNEVGMAFLNYKKKKNQILIETWHGSLGIKKFGYGANDDVNWFHKAATEADMTDYIISNSDFEDQVYRTTFWPTTPIWKFGHPRNDILFTKDEKVISDIKKSICEKYGIDINKKICLYAPTFRDDASSTEQFDLDYSSLKKALSKRFGGDWVVLTRFHVLTTRNNKNLQLSNETIDVSNYSNMQELLLIIDCGITDFSSWICEYLLRRKPGFTYAPDAKEYEEHERQLFFKLDELPFPTATDMRGLVENISNFQDKEYNSKCELFLRDCGSVDDGQSSARVVEELKRIMETGEHK